MTCAIFSLDGKDSLACISFAILQIGKVRDGKAAFIIFGGRASIPVAFLTSSFLIQVITCFSVTGWNLKLWTFIFSFIFCILGCSLLTGVVLSIPMFLAIFM